MFLDIFFFAWIIVLVVMFFLHTPDRDLSGIGIFVFAIGLIIIWVGAEYETNEKKKVYLQMYEQQYGKNAAELRKMELELNIGQSKSNSIAQGAIIGAAVATSIRR